MNKQGSVFIVITFFIATLSLISFGMWYKSAVYLDIVNQQAAYYKNFYLAEAVMNYGIKFVVNNQESFQKNATENKNYSFNNLIEAINFKLKENKFNNIHASITVRKIKKNTISLITRLYNSLNKKYIINLSCEGEILYNAKKNTQKFILKNYNISTIF